MTDKKMGAKPPEDTLPKAVNEGRAFNIDDTGKILKPGVSIDAALIRNLVSGREEVEGTACVPTPYGIVIHGATINGRVALDNVVGANGGPIAALEFHNCFLTQGFSGAHGKFSRLCFFDCTFGDPDPPDRDGRPIPTVDLTDAHVDSDLNMEGVRPVGLGPNDKWPRDRRPYLWIRAVGARINGKVELSRCRLRAPPPREESPICDEVEDALNLTLATIRGDVWLLCNAQCEGRIKLRGAHVGGDVWMSGATVENPGGQAMLLQGTCIAGFLMINGGYDLVGKKGESRTLRCAGEVKLEGAEIGRSLYFEDAILHGDFNAPDLRVSDEIIFNGEVGGNIDLRHARIGGSLDISELRMTGSNSRLAMNDGTVGRALRLARAPDKRKRGPKGLSGFEMSGKVDLRGLSCAMLDDGAGELWGDRVRIRMNHFVYRQTGWHPPGRSTKPSHHFVGHWLLAKQAEGAWPWRWFANPRRLRKENYWEPWQIRRNWIYRQYDTARHRLLSVARYRIDEREYNPQPIEQAIRVARSEGHEDFATHFEMLKQRIEWQYFNRLVRWWLAVAAICLASGWLLLDHGSNPALDVHPAVKMATIFALGLTLLAMIWASTVHRKIEEAIGDRPLLSRILLWVAFLTPVSLLFVHSPWMDRPFHFIVAFLIYAFIRSMAVIAHAIMRIGFGYLRRPMRAITTLILAFLVGWGGVALANREHMLVIAAEPVAGLVGPHQIQTVPDGTGSHLMGSENVAGGERFVRDVSCQSEISEPLFALDILVPLVDLREERRCEVRRVPEDRRGWPNVEAMGWTALWNAIPEMTIRYRRFWWLMQALYAIAGWIIVSLSILTFAQVNKTHAEPPHEHK